ncbi:MAG TPA: hypothetical protein VF403_01190 [Kofleriaceae bacterium]
MAEPWILWIARGKSEIGPEQKSPVGCESGCEPTTGPQDSAAHYFAIERDPTQTRFYTDAASAVVQSVMNTEDYSVMVRNFMATSELQVDYVRARARVTPDPTAAALRSPVQVSLLIDCLRKARATAVAKLDARRS